jgi:predicted DCC family thiol-disulfide oxidoreductase YuxK
MPKADPTPMTVLLFDGECGLCQASVRFILRHERHPTLHFAPLAGQFGSAVLARHPALASANSMVWVTDAEGPDERVVIRSAAALGAARYLGGLWALLGVFVLIPQAIRDRLYDLVARHRHRIGLAACSLPMEEMSGRFLP